MKQCLARRPKVDTRPHGWQSDCSERVGGAGPGLEAESQDARPQWLDGSQERAYSESLPGSAQEHPDAGEIL